MNNLPPDQKLRQRDAYFSLVLAPLEYMTASLRKGDGWDLTDLTPFVNRCRALVAAYDARMDAQKGGE